MWRKRPNVSADRVLIKTFSKIVFKLKGVVHESYNKKYLVPGATSTHWYFGDILEYTLHLLFFLGSAKLF